MSRLLKTVIISPCTYCITHTGAGRGPAPRARRAAARQAEGDVRYRYCASDAHHHHIVCRLCGRSAETECPELSEWADHVAASLGYSDVSHAVEVFGVCSACRKERDQARDVVTRA